MQREKQSKALLSPVVSGAFYAHELVYANSCAKERYSCRTLRRDGVHVRRFSDPSLFPHPCGNQDRQPVFLRLSVQEGTDEGIIRLKPKTGSQRDPHPAAQGLRGSCSNLRLPPSCAGKRSGRSACQGTAAAIWLHTGKSQRLCAAPDLPPPDCEGISP